MEHHVMRSRVVSKLWLSLAVDLVRNARQTVEKVESIDFRREFSFQERLTDIGIAYQIVGVHR